MLLRLFCFLCLGFFIGLGGYLFHGSDEAVRWTGLSISLMIMFGFYIMYDFELIRNRYLKKEFHISEEKEKENFLYSFVGLFVGSLLFLLSIYHAFFEKDTIQSGVVASIAFCICALSVYFSYQYYYVSLKHKLRLKQEYILKLERVIRENKIQIEEIKAPVKKQSENTQNKAYDFSNQPSC